VEGGGGGGSLREEEDFFLEEEDLVGLLFAIFWFLLFDGIEEVS
jgi:hypothetical protein